VTKVVRECPQIKFARVAKNPWHCLSACMLCVTEGKPLLYGLQTQPVPVIKWMGRNPVHIEVLFRNWCRKTRASMRHGGPRTLAAKLVAAGSVLMR